MDQTHKEAVHLGEKVTLSLLQRYYWWIGMKDSVKFWIRRCYYCQSKKTARATVRWPLVSLPLPSRPGQMVGVDLLGPLPKTSKGNTYILLVVDLFSRQPKHMPCRARKKQQKDVHLSSSTTICLGGDARTLCYLTGGRSSPPRSVEQFIG